MAQPTPQAFLKLPTIYEILTLSVAVAALIVSGLSYHTSQSTESAQQENVRVECRQLPSVTFAEVGSGGDLGKRFQVNTSWIMTAYNNSRSPVEIVATAYGMVVPGGLVSDHSLGDTDTHGAAHQTGAAEVTLDPAKSTTFGFSQSIPISPQAAQVPGVLQSTSIYDADSFLADKGFDVFGSDTATRNRIASAHDHQTIVTIYTSRNKSFSGTCYVDSDIWEKN